MATGSANATIGLRDVCYAMLTDTNESHTYEAVKQVAGAIDATITPGNRMSKQYADDGVYDSYAALGEMYMTLEMAALPDAVQEDWLGFYRDDNGVLMKNKDAQGGHFALGFRSLKSDGTFKYVWVYKCKATIPEEKAHTLGSGEVTWSTRKVALEVSPRKSDGLWQAAVDEGADGVSPSVVGAFFNAVYEPASGT